MSKTYFISDTHFSHFNILKYEPIRVLATAEYMANIGSGKSYDEAVEWIKESLETNMNKEEVLYWHDEMLISNWNSTVKDDDVVWFLGDFAFKDTKIAQTIGRRLKGHKRMIMGNHDREKPEFYYTCGFEFVSPYPIILKHFFTLSHAPMPWMHQDSSPYYYIFGHVHSVDVYQTTTANTTCVCVERWQFKPITIPAFDEYSDEPDRNPARERRSE